MGRPAGRLDHCNGGTHAPYREYFDGRTRALLAQRYARDIELFTPRRIGAPTIVCTVPPSIAITCAGVSAGRFCASQSAIASSSRRLVSHTPRVSLSPAATAAAQRMS